MQIVIEIDEELYEEVKGYHELTECELAIFNGTPIPDNATNGDVIKAMFKPNRITRTDDTVNIEYDLTLTPEWWNALYER